MRRVNLSRQIAYVLNEHGMDRGAALRCADDVVQVVRDWNPWRESPHPQIDETPLFARGGAS